MGDVLGRLAALPGPRPRPTELLYVSRADAARRRLANEAELERALVRLGFSVVRPGEHPVAEQRRLFASSRLVVGPHGAGLTNVVFMHPGTALVELACRDYVNACYYRLAQVMDVRYFTFLGDGDGGPGHAFTWEVDVERLLAGLRPLVAGTAR